jgi:hypothetical protein
MPNPHTPCGILRCAFPQILKTALPAFLLLAATTIGFGLEDWRPVTQEEKDMKQSDIDPEAGAEVLFKEIKQNDLIEMRGSEVTTYVRIKVFNDKGVEKVKNVEIQTLSGDDVKDIAARVTKPDGSIVNYTPDRLSSNDLIKVHTAAFEDWQVVSRSFTIPGVVPGAIVEYQWHETEYNRIGSFRDLSTSFPTKTVSYQFKPFTGIPYFVSSFKVPDGVKPGDSGFFVAEVHNIGARPDDPFLPAYYGVCPWVGNRYAYIADYYQHGEIKDNDNPKDYWDNWSKVLHDNVGKYIYGTSRTVSAKAKELSTGISDPMERLHKFYDYCATEIVHTPMNKTYECMFVLMGDLAKDKRGDASDTIANKKGDEFDIDMLFASLAKANGFEVAVARCNDRMHADWSANCLIEETIPDWAVAVKVGKEWKFFQPGRAYVPFGMLQAGNEGTAAIVGNHKAAEVVTTQYAHSNESLLTRNGEFTLSKDGTLQGKVHMRYTGHKAQALKNDYASLSPQKRDEKLKADLHMLMPAADISNIEFKNIADPLADVDVSYEVTVPGYAEATQKRIFVQPDYFGKGAKPMFLRESRKFDVRFPYTWEEHDSVKITYPDNFTVEDGQMPADLLDLPTFAYKAHLVKDAANHQLVYTREMKVNVRDVMLNFYKDLKAIFDAINNEDQNSQTLRASQNSVK